jgi:hypothetical protein
MVFSLNLAVHAAHTPDYRYADPDAEHHSEFDVPTAAHAALIQHRALSRARQFNQSRLGPHRPGVAVGLPSHVVVDEEFVVLQGDAGQR